MVVFRVIMTNTFEPQFGYYCFTSFRFFNNLDQILKGPRAGEVGKQ